MTNPTKPNWHTSNWPENPNLETTPKTIDQNKAVMQLIALTWKSYTWPWRRLGKSWVYKINWFMSLFSGPVNCLWSGFGDWSECSVSCGQGTQQRKRMVLQKASNGGQTCSGASKETRTCLKEACPGKIKIETKISIHQMRPMHYSTNRTIVLN